MNKNALPGWSMNLHPEEFITMNGVVPNARRLLAENNKLKVLPFAEAQAHVATFALNVPKLQHALAAIVDLGARFVRTDFAWNFLQFQVKDGTIWNQSALDRFEDFLKMLQVYHLEPICILYRPPQWAEVYENTSDYWQLYAEYCAKIANTLGKYITYYQLWNEPNNKYAHAHALESAWMDFYAQILASGQLTLKNINPNAIAMINIMVNNDADWVAHLKHYIQFIQRCDRENIVKIISIDHYPATWTASADYLDWSPVDKVITLLADLGLEHKSTAIMETGYTTSKSIFTGWFYHTYEDQENWILDSLNALNAVVYKHNLAQPGKVAFLNWYECYNMSEEEKALETTWVPGANLVELSIRNIEYHFGIHDKDTQRKYAYDSLKRTISFNARNLSAVGPGLPYLFCRGTDGYLRGYNCVTRQWEASFASAGLVTGDVCTVYNPQRQHAEVFFRGGDGYLQYYYYENGWQSSGDGWFHKFSAACSGQLKGTLSAVINPQDNHPEVFLKGYDGQLYRYYAKAPYTPQAAWACEKINITQAGRVRGAIAAVYHSASNRAHTEVFYKGENGRLHYIYYENSNWHWGGESFYPAGEVMGDVATVFNTRLGHPEVFFVNASGLLTHYYVEHYQWTANPALRPENLKVPVFGQIATVYRTGSAFATVFYKGEDGKLHRFSSDNGVWHEDRDSFQKGGIVEGGISAYVQEENGVSHIHVVYRDKENQVHWFVQENNTWVEKALLEIN